MSLILRFLLGVLFFLSQASRKMVSGAGVWENRTYLWGEDRGGGIGTAAGIGGLLGVIQKTGDTTHTYTPVDDGLGNIRAYLDETGQTVADFDYAPFGERLAVTGNAADVPNFGWQSRYRDPLSRLVYFGHRWYAPELGRWLSRDPSGESGGLNLHGYCHNDPINGWDYLGLGAEEGQQHQRWGWYDIDQIQRGQSVFSNLFQLVGNTVGGFFEHMNPTDPESSYRQGMEEVPAKVEEAMQEIGSSAAPDFVKEGLKFHLGLTMGATNLLPHHALGSASELGEFVGEKGSKSVGILWEEVARGFSENPSYMLGQMSAPSVLLKGRLGRVKGQHPASIFMEEGASASLRPLGSNVRRAEVVDPIAAKTPLTSWVGDLRAAGLKDAHYVIQDASVRNLPGYSTRAAPGVQLPGPSTAVGTPHYLATQVQRQAGGGTYAAERRIGYKALRRSGFPEPDAPQMIFETDDWFRGIGATPSTPTRIPGNR